MNTTLTTLLTLALLTTSVVFAQDDGLWDDDAWDDEPEAQIWSGFVESGFGTRIETDPLIDKRHTLEEVRLRVESEWRPGSTTFGFKGDAAYDGVENRWDTEIRELSLTFTPGHNADVKIGRQVQTWGTGDLVFLNDLFPKDFVSFFAGRDDEYLKAPGNSIRVSHFSNALNIDFVWTPEFEPDVYLTGERFGFFSPLLGRNIAPQPPVSAVEPQNSLGNGEFALRLFRTIKGREYAVYAYHGFFKQPTALTPALEPTFAPLTAIGASVRLPAGPGLLNAETSVYFSRDDRSGTDPLVPNDQLRLLVGYEWEAQPNFTIGLQYYLEWTRDHDELLNRSPAPQFEPDEQRHVLTNRLTYRASRDRHTFSLFTFYSPSDRDFYLRPAYTWRYSDQWSLTTGANIFGGQRSYTFFNQLQDASNIYARIRFQY